MVNPRCFPTHRLHFTGLTLNFYLSLPGVLERYQSFGSMSSGAIEAVNAPLHFLHKEGSNSSRVHLVTQFIFLWPSPPDKTGNTKTLNICLPLTFGLHTVRWRTSAPQTGQNQSTEPHSWVLPNAAMLIGWWVCWLKFEFKGLDHTTSTTMRKNALMTRS